MIIGISGYMGSGKDTVAKIIQYLDYVNDIELRNKNHLESLKATPMSFEDWLKPKIHPSGYDIGGSSFYQIAVGGWKIKKWATKVKEIASIITGVPVERFEDQEFKSSYMGPEWNYIMRLPRESLDQELVLYEERRMTFRELLQRIGTNAMRDNVHKNVWVNALMSSYNDYDKWIISDTRFENEAKIIKDKGGIIVRVNRYKDWPVKMENLHESEVSLDDWEFDEVIHNTGNIEDLIPKVKTILVKHNLL